MRRRRSDGSLADRSTIVRAGGVTGIPRNIVRSIRGAVGPDARVPAERRSDDLGHPPVPLAPAVERGRRGARQGGAPAAGLDRRSETTWYWWAATRATRA